MWKLVDILTMPALETYTTKDGTVQTFAPKSLQRIKGYIRKLCPPSIDEAWLRDTTARAQQVRDLAKEPGAPKDAVIDATKAYQKLYRVLLNGDEPPTLPIDRPDDVVRPTTGAQIDRVEREEQKKAERATMNEHDWVLDFSISHFQNKFGHNACAAEIFVSATLTVI
jgi:hypothetical protein